MNYSCCASYCLCATSTYRGNLVGHGLEDGGGLMPVGAGQKVLCLLHLIGVPARASWGVGHFTVSNHISLDENTLVLK